jgi:hypothetical protein
MKGNAKMSRKRKEDNFVRKILLIKPSLFIIKEKQITAFN